MEDQERRSNGVAVKPRTKPPIVTSGSVTCVHPGCKIAIVLAVGRSLPRFCWDHMPALYDEQRAIDAEPTR